MDDMMTGSFAHDKPYGIFKTEVYIKVFKASIELTSVHNLIFWEEYFTIILKAFPNQD